MYVYVDDFSYVFLDKSWGNSFNKIIILLLFLLLWLYSPLILATSLVSWWGSARR
jgi:hypothetical protein